jgi:hypothetical protein
MTSRTKEYEALRAWEAEGDYDFMLTLRIPCYEHANKLSCNWSDKSAARNAFDSLRLESSAYVGTDGNDQLLSRSVQKLTNCCEKYFESIEIDHFGKNRLKNPKRAKYRLKRFAGIGFEGGAHMHILCKYPESVSKEQRQAFDMALELKWEEVAGYSASNKSSSYFYHILKKYDDGIHGYLSKKAGAGIDTVMPELCFT